MSTVVSAILSERLRRVFAASCAGLVLALAICAASPVAHEWLHGDDHGTAADAEKKDICAVALFAGGVSLPLASVEVAAPAAMPLVVSVAKASEIFLVAPRFLRQPERGPPMSLVS